MKTGWRALAARLAGKAKLALLIPLSLAMAATAADTVPQVTLATPGSTGTGDGTISRFTLRFSEDMVPLGDPRAPAPATNDCKLPASSRWVDTRTWVLEFERRCPAAAMPRSNCAPVSNRTRRAGRRHRERPRGSDRRPVARAPRSPSDCASSRPASCSSPTSAPPTAPRSAHRLARRIDGDLFDASARISAARHRDRTSPMPGCVAQSLDRARAEASGRRC